MDDLIALTASEAAAAIRQRKIGSRELVDALLDHIASRDAVVGAWAYLDPERARAAALACDNAVAPTGPLHGVPVGVKDVLDTADMPTEYGSKIHEGHRPTRDAACVALIRRAGGIVLGKTVSTEFAMYQPNKTTNPHNSAHTPGGSSSGSAAAVADGQVAVALGTQTSGSIIRPAAFCGVIGYKPTFGTFAIEGAKTLAASLDTLGLLARSVDDIGLMRSVLLGAPDAAPPLLQNLGPMAGLRLGVWMPPYAASPLAENGLQRALDKLATAGLPVNAISMPVSFADLNDVHADIMAFETARNHVFEFEPSRRSRIAAPTAAVMSAGWEVDVATYLRRRAETRAARIAFDRASAAVDVLLVPAAVGEAPVGIHATGDPVFNRVWSLLGVPALTLPVGMGPLGLPLGVQLVARQDDDGALLTVARALQPLFAGE